MRMMGMWVVIVGVVMVVVVGMIVRIIVVI